MNDNLFESILDNNNVKVYLFVEDIKKYIEIDYIKIVINEQSGGYYCFNNSIDICCQLNKNTITHLLYALKYNKLIYEGKHSRNPKTGRLEIIKKDIVSDVILYVSLNDKLIRILEFKNLMILYYNDIEYNLQLTCDYYIMFSNIQSIKNEQYLRSIYNKIDINVSYNKSYKPLNIIGNISDDYDEDNYNEDDWGDWDDYNENPKQHHSLLESFKESLSKINCFKL